MKATFKSIESTSITFSLLNFTSLIKTQSLPAGVKSAAGRSSPYVYGNQEPQRRGSTVERGSKATPCTSLQSSVTLSAITSHHFTKHQDDTNNCFIWSKATWTIPSYSKLRERYSFLTVVTVVNSLTYSYLLWSASANQITHLSLVWEQAANVV